MAEAIFLLPARRRSAITATTVRHKNILAGRKPDGAGRQNSEIATHSLQERRPPSAGIRITYFALGSIADIFMVDMFTFLLLPFN